jgi:hypothetical protein
VKLQLSLLEDWSVTVQLTPVVPVGKQVPEAGVQTSVGPGQLSKIVGLKFTTAQGLPPATIFAGQTMVGGWVSFTVTVKLFAVVFPDASVTEQFTVFTPFGKAEPEGGVQTTEENPGQLSEAVGRAKVTTAVQRLGSVECVMFAVAESVGNWVSLTVTVKVQAAVFPDASATVQVTGVTPFAKVPPDAGVHVGMPTPGQLSETVGSGQVTRALQLFTAVEVTMFAGQMMVGGVNSCTVMVAAQVDDAP